MRRVGALVLCGAAVAGCGAGTKTVAQTVTQPSSGVSAAQSPASASTSSTAARTTSGSTAVLAQTTVYAPGTHNDTVDIALRGLRVHGALMTLTVRFTPHFQDQSPSDTISLYDMSNNGLSQNQISLVDPVGLKRYLVVQDSDSNWLGSDENNTAAVNGSSVDAYYTFPAPPATVSTVDVYLGPFAPFRDVPIQR